MGAASAPCLVVGVPSEYSSGAALAPLDFEVDVSVAEGVGVGLGLADAETDGVVLPAVDSLELLPHAESTRTEIATTGTANLSLPFIASP